MEGLEFSWFIFSKISSILFNYSYGCQAINLYVETRDSRIDEILGDHKPKHNNKDVLTFYSFHSQTQFLPKLLGTNFMNLKTIMITKSYLNLIEFRDFKNMKKLQKLYLPANQIEKLPPCTFRYAENLDLIDLSGNRISFLQSDTFTYLPKLTKIYLALNDITKVEENFMTLTKIETVDMKGNTCISACFGCVNGLNLRDFQNISVTRCGNGFKICWINKTFNILQHKTEFITSWSSFCAALIHVSKFEVLLDRVFSLKVL